MAPGRTPVQGIVQITRKGVGYLPWPREAGSTKELEDIEIQTENLGGALNGDTVLVEGVGTKPRPQGKVIKVESRAKTEFVATVKKVNGAWVATPADQRFYRPIALHAVPENLQEQMKVLVALTSFDGGDAAQGKVLEIIGAAGEHRVEMNAIVLEHGFKTEFP